MMAIVVKALADLRRRRLQGAVIFVIVLLAAGTGTMAVTLLSQTRDPYQAAFAAQKGAHLQVSYDGRMDPSLLATTPGLVGATAAGGPYPVAESVRYQLGGLKFSMATLGRNDPGGKVETLKVVAGHWPRADNEIALTRSFTDLNQIAIGDRLKVVSKPREPVFTVVAKVVDIDEASADLGSQHAWVPKSAVTQLQVPGQTDYLVDYRFATDPSSAQLQGYVDRLRAVLPPGSIGGSVNYLLIRSVFNITNSILTSVLIAFSVFALAAAAAIVANLVTGMVISAYREIGIMKAVGFTPAQVVGVLVLQILLPTLAGCLIGIPAGTLLSQPLLANSSHALGLAYVPTFSVGLDLLTLAGVLVLVVLAATLPALRAGLLKPAAVIAGASAPRGASGRWLRRLATRLRSPQAVTLGSGEAFARPLRGALTMLAVLLGVVTVTVAVGMPRSFDQINNSETGAGKYQVVVDRSPAYPDSDLMRVLNAQPETARVVGQGGQTITVPGIGDPVNTSLWRGDVSKVGYLLIAGRWFTAPGEVVAPRGLLHDGHLHIGDSFTGSAEGKAIRLRLVGEVYDVSNLGHVMFTDMATYAEVRPDIAPESYLVTLAPGADVAAYVRRVTAAQPDFIDAHPSNTSTIAPVKIIDSVMILIAAVLGLIAVAGVFNTVLLNTRERVRDTAVLKAVGMSPRQVLLMVAASAGLLALVGGVLAVPAGLGVHHVLLDAVSSAAGNDTPPASYGVFRPFELALIPLLGLAVAVAAALIPGRWAARTKVVEVLHSE
jgi:putative ABC transport system permease protein